MRLFGEIFAGERSVVIVNFAIKRRPLLLTPHSLWKVLQNRGDRIGIGLCISHSEHNVWYVAENCPGCSVPTVLALGRSEDALLLTADQDFGDLVEQQGHWHTGILLIRLAVLDPDEKAVVTDAPIAAHGAEMRGAFSVLRRNGLRIRTAYP